MMLSLPFFDERHRTLAADLQRFAAERIGPHAAAADSGDVDAAGREFLRSFGAAGFLRLLVPGETPNGGGGTSIDCRSICLVREAFAAESGVADAVFAVQGLSAFPIALAGSDDQSSRARRAYSRGRS